MNSQCRECIQEKYFRVWSRRLMCNCALHRLYLRSLSTSTTKQQIEANTEKCSTSSRCMAQFLRRKEIMSEFWQTLDVCGIKSGEELEQTNGRFPFTWSGANHFPMPTMCVCSGKMVKTKNETTTKRNLARHHTRYHGGASPFCDQNDDDRPASCAVVYERKFVEKISASHKVWSNE